MEGHLRTVARGVTNRKFMIPLIATPYRRTCFLGSANASVPLILGGPRPIVLEQA
jgi:hypothetical protein